MRNFMMKISTQAILLLTLSFAAGSSAQTQTQKSERPITDEKIEKVVVFSDRAEVTRTQTMKCSAGSANVIFQNIPNTIDVRTLRAEATRAQALGVRAVTRRLTESLDARVRTLRDELQALRQARQATRFEGQDHAERFDTAQSYIAYFRALLVEEMRSPAPNMQRVDAMLSMLKAEASAYDKAVLAQQIKERELSAKEQKVQAKLSRLAPNDIADVIDASVSLSCKGNDVVRLTYVVPGARWQPEYDIRHFENGKGAQRGQSTLAVSASITQSTGEDWKQAKVWLSTAKPRLGGEAPMPQPIWLNGSPVEKTRTLVSAQQKRAERLQGAGTVSKARNGQASLDDGGKSFVLKLKEPASIFADSRPYWFPVERLSIKAKSARVVVPKLSPYVYQSVELANPAPYPLLAGTVHVYRNGTYMGDVAGEYRAPGERFELSLGLDDGVRIERVNLMGRNRKGGLLSDKKIEHAHRIRLENRSDKMKTVEVREQIPVSKTDEVKVALKTDEYRMSPGYRLDKERGFVTWTVKLAPNQKSKRDVAFTIQLPSDWDVN